MASPFLERFLAPYQPPPPEYPPGCMISSSSPAVDRKIGTVLRRSGLGCDFREILWSNGTLSVEGLLYLRAYYRDVSPPPDDF